MHNKIFGYALVFTLISSVLASAYPVLDEESYLYIAEEMSLSRPYDWMLPWPPYSQSYRYAHPPLFLLWVKVGVLLFAQSIGWLKLFLGLPFRLLLGFSAGWFFHAQIPKNQNHALMWVVSPIVLMVGARSAMPDLMLCALGTSAMAFFLSASTWRGYLLCGVLLGCAGWIKYPGLLLWIPILFACSSRKNLAWIALGFVSIWGIGEVWLWSIYDDWHLKVVLSTADHVGRGPLWDRSIGFFMRLFVGCPFLLLCVVQRRIWMLATVVLLVPLYFLLGEMTMGERLVASLWIAIPFVGMSICVRRLDFFSVWWLTLFVGVCVTHNFASPRYLVLGMVPLVILVSREIEGISSRWLYALGSMSLLLSAVVSFAEHAHAQETIQLVERLEVQPNMYYSGEWTFRWAMRKKGALLWKGEEGVLVQPKQAVGGEKPKRAQNKSTIEGEEGIRILLDRENSVGYYSETLGFWPLGFHRGAMEELSVWKP